MTDQDIIVSFNDELLTLVDENDSIVGYADKQKCHSGNGLLHQAFSIFIFNSDNLLMLQKRSSFKELWPLYWSNSVCSHPRHGENYEKSIFRRLKEEIGLQVPVTFLFRFQYQANYKNIGSENELCSVYFGRSDEPPKVNSYEIADWKYIDLHILADDIKSWPERYTPWLKIELEIILNNHLHTIHS